MEINCGAKIGIVGSGLIGRAWSMLFAAAGYRVALYDTLAEQMNAALNEIAKELKRLEQEGILRGQLSAEQQLTYISITSELKELVKDAFYIQECIPENIEMKCNLYSQLDEILEPQTIVASSTSTFMPSLFSEGLKSRANMLVAHPLNPPYYIPLVEIVPAAWTNAAAVTRTRALMQEIGQKPVTLTREIQGFATNRIQYAILNEVWHLVANNVLNVADIDSVMTNGLGLRYALLGPLETAHLNANGILDYIKRFGNEIHAVSDTYAVPPNMQEDTVTLEHIAKQLEAVVPVHSLDERRAARDKFLTQLATLKRDFE